MEHIWPTIWKYLFLLNFFSEDIKHRMLENEKVYPRNLTVSTYCTCNNANINCLNRFL
jgi:hypothetical protein